MAPIKVHDLDERDWAIIELLRAGTISNSAVAKELGVSEGMIRQRIKRLRELGILSLRGLINPEILANRQVVWLGANVVESHLLAQKAEEISRLKDVLSVSIVSGRFDLVIELLLDSHHGLVDFLIEELSQVEGIGRTESFVTLKTYSKFV
jgi:Lrp/AsnC family transcriptional regulator, regulator for asnA, asnC and gidA